MAGLLYSFDSPFSFREEQYYFRYKGIAFKLVNGGQTYQHYLLSIVPEIVYPNETDKVALEFLGCLAFDAHFEVIFKSSFGSSSYDDRLFKSPVRVSKVGRSMPSHFVNQSFPNKLPNITNQRKRYVLSMYQESLISRHDLPHYAFLSYWKILTILENRENPTDKIWRELGSDFFAKIGYSDEESAKNYLKETLRNRIGHALGRGRRDIFIMDPELHLELSQLNSGLDKLVRADMQAFFADSPPLLLCEVKGDMPTYMTEAQRYGWKR